MKAHPAGDSRVRRSMRHFDTGELAYLPFMVVRTYWLGTDPATVYHAVRYYHANPERRHELASSRALDRIRSGQAVVRHQDPDARC
jgi:hypothetical protein